MHHPIIKAFALLMLAGVLFTALLGFCHASEALTRVDPNKLTYEPLHFSLPQAERVVLDNGMVLYIFANHELPLLNISVLVRTGSIYDPEGREGLAELTATVMRTGGTKAMSGDAIDETLESFAGSVEMSMGMESATASFSVLKKDTDRGLSILSQILMQPAFEEKKLKLAKDLKKEELRRITDDPQRYAFREFNRFFYRGNPRGRLPSLSSIEHIDRADLVKFYERFFHPSRVMMAISGDITKNEAIAKIKARFGGWQRRDDRVEPPPLPQTPKAHLAMIPKDIPQSIVITGHLAPGKREGAYYAFEVLDFILGSGSFKSRIFQKVRTDLGLAYSAGSFYRGRSDYGVFGAYAMTRSAATVRVLQLLQGIIQDAGTMGVSPEELALAKKSINNSFIFSFASASQITRQQMMVEYDRLPGDYLQRYRDRIERVTAEELKEAALRYLSKDHTVILVLGQEKAFDQPLDTVGPFERVGAASP